jgi:hypothetical protein
MMSTQRDIAALASGAEAASDARPHLGDSATTPGFPSTHSPHVISQEALLEEAKSKWRQLFSGTRTQEEGNRSRQPAMTTRNLRTNFPWGDQLGPKDPHVTRLYSINVNGISLDRRGGSFNEICRSMKEIQADIFCAQEHNLDTTQHSTKRLTRYCQQ